MKASIDWKGGMLLEGKNAEGMSTYFDTSSKQNRDEKRLHTDKKRF